MLQDYRRLSLIIIYVPTPITNLSMINYIHYLRYLEPHKTSKKTAIMDGWLVVSTPLKNHGIRQLG